MRSLSSRIRGTLLAAATLRIAARARLPVPTLIAESGARRFRARRAGYPEGGFSPTEKGQQRASRCRISDSSAFTAKPHLNSFCHLEYAGQRGGKWPTSYRQPA